MMMSRSLDDHSLVTACRAGRTDAFDVLVERYQERLYPTILRLIGLARGRRGRLPGRVRSRVREARPVPGRQLVLHVGLSHRGQPGAERPSQTADPVRRTAGAQAAGLAGGPSRRRVGRIRPCRPPRACRTRAHRGDALNRLSPEHRVIVVLKDFDGHRYEEISAILDIPVGTVRSRLHRARCELRDRLRGLVDEPQPIRQGSSPVP